MWEPFTQSDDVLIKVVTSQMYEEVDDDVAIQITDGFQRRPPIQPTPAIANPPAPVGGGHNQRENVDTFNEALRQFQSNADDDDDVIANFDYDDVILMSIQMPTDTVGAVSRAPAPPRPTRISDSTGPGRGANNGDRQTGIRPRNSFNSVSKVRLVHL